MSEVQRRSALGYARVSTIEQSQEGVSLDVQKARIKAYAEAKGLELVELLSDDGLSGKSLDRPGLREVMRRCEQGEVANVIVWKLDRLTRKTLDLLSMIENLFLAHNIELHSVSESLDSSSAHGRFVLTLLGSLSQLEREQISERTRNALEYKRQNGQPTSHAPFGFRANGSRERMVPVPQELAVVDSILERWRRGGSYSGIARELNAEGVATKRGGRWHPSTVSSIVRRRDWYSAVLKPILGLSA